MEGMEKIEITSQHRLLDLKLKAVWKYRDLIFLFVRRNFVSQYKQTILGPLWAIVQPLLTTVVFTVIFGNLAGLPIVDTAEQAGMVIPGFLFYMSGTVCWHYFSGCLNACANTFRGNEAILGKVYFPRLVMPLSTVASNLISFGIQLAMFVGFYAYYLIAGGTGMHLSGYIVLLPLLVLQMGLLGMGFGLIISAMTTKYRDLAMLVGFGIQLWQYGTPVAYGLSLIPEKYMGLYMLNPMTPIVTTFRYAFMGSGFLDWGYYGIGWLTTLVILTAGVLVFNKTEKTFMDTI